MANDYKLKVTGEFDDKMSKGLGSAKQSLGSLGDGLDALKSKASGFGDFLKANLVSSAITSSLAAIRDGIKETTEALVDLGKEAYTEGAKLEQSIGGVQTMFKNNALEVELNASAAWKSGISKNDYMEQVTSFSAALISSLSGDTERAAEVANMAILDMADNANKFGTDISSIQNAYQGFAKQNYTMLDNLKLGYGGTKEEMERMLADAEKLTGIHYDISNLSDVFNAIHAIQSELGVAGVSAQEARTTMEGSAKKMKAAWKNLLGNMTLGNGILGNVDELKESVGDFANNFIPSVENILDALPTLADGIVDIADDMMEKFGTELVTRAGPLAQAGGRIMGTIVSGLARAVPQLLSIGGQVVSHIAASVMENAPEILSAVGSLVAGIPDKLMDYAGVLVEWGVIAWDRLTDWLQHAPWSKLVDTMVNGLEGAGGFLKGFRDWLDNVTFDNIAEELGLDKLFTEENTAKMIEAFGDFFVDLVKTGSKLATTFASVGLDIMKAIVEAIKGNSDTIGDDLAEAFETVTVDIGTWLADNIDDILKTAADALILFFFNLAPKAVYGFAKGLSQVNWAEFGKNMWEGIVESMESGIDSVWHTVVGMSADIFGFDDATKQYLDSFGAIESLKYSAMGTLGKLLKPDMDDFDLQLNASALTGEMGRFYYDLWSQLMATGSYAIPENLKGMGIEFSEEFVDAMIQGINNKAAELAAAGKELTIAESIAAVDEIYNNTKQDWLDAHQSIIDDVGTLDWSGLGADIVDGISNGVNSNGSLIDTLWNMAVGAFNVVKGFFGINSPSTLMRDEIGRYIPEGIAVGIDTNTDSIKAAMADVRNVVLGGADVVLGNTDAARYGGGGDAHTLNVGGVTNNIYGAQGQDEASLADAVVDILINRLRSEGAVFA